MQIVVIITKNEELATRVLDICEELEDCTLLWHTNSKGINTLTDALFLLDVDTIGEEGYCFRQNNTVCLKSSLKDTKRTMGLYKKGAMDVKQTIYPHIIKNTIQYYLKKEQKQLV